MRLVLIWISLLYFGKTIGQQLALPYSNGVSGIYTTDVTLSLFHDTPGVTIFYTLNGNEPTPQDFIYTGPITLSNRNGDPNIYSEIPTNPSFDYPTGAYDLDRANDRGWLPPYSEVYKINVIRYRAYKPGFAPSETVTQTFMIDPLGADRYDFPILSLVVDSTDLFSAESGIYVYGNHPDGNYTQKGVAWERIMNLELFDETGTLVLDHQVRGRMHGGGSRSSCKKNFRIYAENGTVSNFNFPFFENYALEQYKRIILRGGGHSPSCFPRDDLANMITEGLSVDQQHVRHIILFINGEYWGIHTIKERVDNYFIQNRYGLDDDEITIIDQEYDIQGSGSTVDAMEMESLEDFIIANDMSLDENYAYVLEKIDVDNYIDYMCSEIFLSNVDWVYSNVMIWRKTGPFDPSKEGAHDGRFRWIFYDFDGAFGGDCSQAYYTVNTLGAATITSGTFASYTRFFRGLLDNLMFRKKFVNRMCDLMNSQYRKNRVVEKVWEIYNALTPSMTENVDRWRYPSTATTLYTRQFETPSLTQWNLNFYYLDIFAKRRQRKVRDHMMMKWGYPDSSLVTVNVNDPEMGMVQVNSILINENLAGVNSIPYPWDGYYMNTVELPLTAIPKPGYRFVEWQGTGITNQTITWNPDGDSTFIAVFENDPDYEPILINELMSSNTSYLTDNFNDYDDWLELFNPNNNNLNLSGCRFEWNGKTWTIPNGTEINANGYLLFWFDAETYQGINHTNGKIPNVVSGICLKNSSGEIIDSIAYPATTSNYSFGRYPNGSGSFNVFQNPTPQQNNNLSSQIEIQPSILKVYPNPSNDIIYLSVQTDFEIYNLQGQKIMQIINQNWADISTLSSGSYILVTKEKEIVKIIRQ
ncbi:MAG: CotH kinase family protein [Crocinitomicaceae bacterium]|nr:CotH kinase family protein [Crocinitomicaceae bacterium]